MAQEYTIQSWQCWENEDGPVRDMHGNYKGTVVFEEHHNEPVDATFKTQPAAGDKKYGTISEYTTKAGKTRTGFKSAPRPQEAQTSFYEKVGTSKSTYQPRDDNAIRAQWAIGQGVQAAIAVSKDGKLLLDDIEKYATHFYTMVERVKDSSLKAPGVKVESGDDPELDSIMQQGQEYADSIDLADIPF